LLINELIIEVKEYNMSMKTSLVLTELLTPEDEVDQKISDTIQLTVQNILTMNLISFWGHSKFNKEKCDESYLKIITKITTALFKANAHRRNFHRLVEIFIKKCSEDPSVKNTKVDILFNKVDLQVEVDGFLSQLKTSLDLMAQSLRPIFGIHMQTWKRKMNSQKGKILSGQAVINNLNNLSKDIKVNVNKLIEFIENNAEYITSVVVKRDQAIHLGNISNIQWLRYSVKDNMVYPPTIAHSDTNVEYLEDYLNVTLNDFVIHAEYFITITLSNLLPSMFLKKEKDNKYKWYGNMEK